MNTRALRVLEFEKIREQLSLFAQSDAGKALCLKLIPAGDRTEVEERLAAPTRFRPSATSPNG